MLGNFFLKSLLLISFPLDPTKTSSLFEIFAINLVGFIFMLSSLG